MERVFLDNINVKAIVKISIGFARHCPIIIVDRIKKYSFKQNVQKIFLLKLNKPNASSLLWIVQKKKWGFQYSADVLLFKDSKGYFMKKYWF